MGNYVQFPYGKSFLPIEYPEDGNFQLIRGNKIEPSASGEEIVNHALENPIASPTLAELSKDAKKIVIITNDNTRPMPSKITLPAIIGHLFHPERYYDITILIATGLHRQMTEEEMEEQYGKEFYRSHKFVCHDATDPERNVFIKKLSTGNDLYIEKIAAECDLLISEGFIEPHFFAGFSGGRKSILPGISGKDTIMFNHQPANIAAPLATQGVLTGNPIHMECTEAAKAAKLQFILNVALNEEKQITAAFAGEPVAAHAEGCAYVRSATTTPVQETDIVITSNSGYPLDRNFYQVVKGIDTAAKIVKKGGVIIAVAQCMDGVGHGNFTHLIADCSSAEELCAEMATDKYAVDKWQVQVYADALAKAHIILVSEGVSPEEAESLFVQWAPDLNTAVEMAKAITGPASSISFLPDGPVTIPVVQ